MFIPQKPWLRGNALHMAIAEGDRDEVVRILRSTSNPEEGRSSKQKEASNDGKGVKRWCFFMG